MPNVGPFELAIVLIIALVVFGPKRLPELGRSLGRGIREFKGSVSGDHDDDDERKPAEIEPPPASAEKAPPADAEKAPPATAEKAPEDEPVAHDRG